MPTENVTTKYKVDVSDLKKNIADANKTIKLANAEFKNATAGLDDWSKSADGLSAKIKEQNTIVDAEKKKLEALKEQLQRLVASQENGQKIIDELTAKHEAAVKTYGAESEEAKKYAKQLEQAETAQERNAKAADDLRLKIINQDTAVKKAEKQSADYTKQLDAMGDEMTDDEKAAKKADDALEDMGKATKNAGKEAKDASNGGFTVLKGVLANLATEIVDGVVGALKSFSSEIVNVVTESAAAGDEIDKMSQKLGLSREAYQEWDFVLSQAGVDINNMQTGLKTLTNKIDDAKNGSKTATELFSKLGLSVEDLNKMTREDVFERVIYGMQGMADSTERAALANDLFGKSGQELTPLFNETAASTEALKQSAHDYGMIMSDEAVEASVAFTDSLDKLKRTATGLKNNLGGEFLPAITGIMDRLSNIITGKEGFDGMFDDVEALIEKAAPKIIDIVVKLGDSISKVIKKAAPRLIKILTSNLPKITKTLLNLVGQIAKSLLEAAPELIRAAMQIITDVLNMLAEELPGIVDMIVEMIPDIVEALTDPEMLTQLFNGAIKLLMALVDAIPVVTDALVDALPTIIDNVLEFLLDPNTLEQLAKAGFKLFFALSLGIPRMLPKLIVSLGEIVESIATHLAEPVKGVFSEIWENLTDTFSGVGDWFGERFDEAWQSIKDAFSSVGEFFDDLWDTISSRFTAIGTAIGDSVGGAFKAVINESLKVVEKTINAGIGLINDAISIINKLPGVDVDDVPEISFGRLAKGGVITKPTFAQIGEAGDEAVIPLENNKAGLKRIASLIADELNRGAVTTGNTSGGTVYNFNQTNNSPAALSRWEIYRQTKNLIAAAKGV